MYVEWELIPLISLAANSISTRISMNEQNE